MTSAESAGPASERDPDAIRSILNAGLIAHVGVTTDDGPVVLPMVYGVRGAELLIHGSVANAMMRAGRGLDVCVTVTLSSPSTLPEPDAHHARIFQEELGGGW